ncbi:MAG: class I tRNA ligase family protein [Planctomycetes bacterium]|nr:class I tRNA ligase family protein [Planctomycetota bacterium]
MFQSCVRYGEMRYLGTFRTEIDTIRRGDRLVVRSGRGVEVGLALTPSRPLDETAEREACGEVLRKVTPEDVHQVEMLDQLGKTKAFRHVQQRMRDLALPMKLSYIEHLLGGEKVVIYFRADGRVDFRNLVRDLSQHFQTRVVMKQIGARDEARLLGEWNDCGRELCCRTHLQHLAPIPMKMAKSQKTTLDPAKISGRCGRLKCCLRYEHDTYVEFKKRLPRLGHKVRTMSGVAEVIGTDILSQTVTVEFPSGARVNVPVGEVLPVEAERAAGPRTGKERASFYVTVPFFNIEMPFTLRAVYAAMAADVLARTHAGLGAGVNFLTGIKDHSRTTQRGEKDETALLSRGDRYLAELQEQWASLSVSASQVYRTQAEIHKKTVADFFRKLKNNDDIYCKRFQGSHCTGCHSSFPGPGAGGTPCIYCGAPLEVIDEEAWFFRLSKYAKKLLAHLKTREAFIRPRVLKLDIESRVNSGLGDVIVARSTFDYGIPIPGDDRHLVSGWFEGLLAYVSALADGKTNPLLETFWPADVHLVTRENLWIHAVVWPAMLFAGELELPGQIVVAGDWQTPGEEGEEPRVVLSRSLIEEYGGESLRYFLLSGIPFGLSGTFRREEFEKVLQRDLLGDFSSLVQRVLSMVEKYGDSRVPHPGEEQDPDDDLRAIVENLERDYRANIDTFQFATVLASVWECLRALARYLDETKPWQLPRSGPEADRLAAVLYHLLETLRIAAVFLYPFLPRTAERLAAKLGAETPLIPTFEKARWGGLSPGAPVDRATPLFPELETHPGLIAARPVTGSSPRRETHPEA